MNMVPLSAIQRSWLASQLPAVARFEFALRFPAHAQAQRLSWLLEKNAHTAYGRQYKFETIRSPREYQEAVPIVDYDALAPWIDRAAAGEMAVLTQAPVRMFERSGGSTAATKLIPYNADLLADFSAATNPWLFDLHRRRPELIGTRSYWSLSPVAQKKQRTSGGLPIGIEDDTEYFGPVARYALQRMMAVPSSVAHISDMDSWRMATLRHLLGAADLGFISIWSPTFLSLLMRALEERLPELLGLLSTARRDEIKRGLDREGALVGEAIWPRLQCISSWMDGIAGEFVVPLRRWFPRTSFQAKGLLATEGVVSFPYGDERNGVAAVTSHFLEFLDLDRPGKLPLLAHELRIKGQYSPILSTGGGLYRYHLKDVVECVGHQMATPLLRFIGKLDCVSDTCGEKINARQVEKGLERGQRTLGITCDVALLAPVWPNGTTTTIHYCLFVNAETDDATLAKLALLVEEELLQGHAFRYARELGQLGEMHFARIPGGSAAVQDTLIRAGQRAGDIKPTHLDPRPIWGETFGPGLPAREWAKWKEIV
jgi:GH3 auxin-responsive promoter